MLYLLPNELLVAIVEYCDQYTRKNLSLVSRRLRHPSQCVVFKTVYIRSPKFETSVPRFAVEGGGHLPEVMQNDRLLSYIQTIVISTGGASHYEEMNTIEPLFTVLHQMPSLRDIRLVCIPFTTTMLDRLCKVLSTRLCNVELWRCSYPADYTIQQTALKIHSLGLALERESIDIAPPPTTTKALVAIIEKSLSSISSLSLISRLSMSSGLGVLTYLGAMPRLASLNIQLLFDRNDQGLRKFLAANPQIVEFTLDWHFYELPVLPPSTLPNVRTIRASAELIQHLLPGRPVTAVEIRKSSKFKIMVDGLRALPRSAAPIVELNLHLHHYRTHLDEILDVVVKTVPRLERMWLSFRARLSQIVLRHLIRLDSLREVNLSVYVKGHDNSSERSKIECTFREGLKGSIYFNWSRSTALDAFITFANES